MSELNLIPNPQLMLVQAVVFSAQIYVVNRFFVVPYSKLRKRRDAVTVGADKQSSEMNTEIAKLTKDIQVALIRVSDEIKKAKQSQVFEAKQVKEQALSQAQKYLTDHVNEARRSAAQQYIDEKNKVSALVDRFTDELFAKIVTTKTTK